MDENDEMGKPTNRNMRWWLVGGLGLGLVILTAAMVVLASSAGSGATSYQERLQLLGSIGLGLVLLSLLVVGAVLVFRWRPARYWMARWVAFLLFGSGSLIQLGVIHSELMSISRKPVEAELIVPGDVLAQLTSTHEIRYLGETAPFPAGEWRADCARLWTGGTSEVFEQAEAGPARWILVGGADRRSLRPGNLHGPLSNQTLARRRAEATAACLHATRYGAAASVTVFTRVPEIEASGLEDRDYEPDRTVKVYGIWETPRFEMGQSVRVLLREVTKAPEGAAAGSTTRASMEDRSPTLGAEAAR